MPSYMYILSYLSGKFKSKTKDCTRGEAHLIQWVLRGILKTHAVSSSRHVIICTTPQPQSQQVKTRKESCWGQSKAILSTKTKALQGIHSIRPLTVWFNMKFNYVPKNILSGKKTAPSVNLKLPGYPQTWKNLLFTFFPYGSSVTSRKEVYRSLFVKALW